MVNYKARSNKVLLEKYVTGTAEGSHTFTFSAIDFSKVAYLQLEINLTVTGALELQLKAAGKTAAYYADGFEMVAGTETLINVDNSAEWIIVPTIAADNPIIGIIKLWTPTIASEDRLFGTSEMNFGGNLSHLALFLNTDSIPLTEIIVETDTSTWISLSEISLYMVMK